MASMTLTAGAMMRGMVRRELERAKWEGHRVEWIEQKGFLESRFLINGSDHVVKAFADLADAVEESDDRGV